MSYIVTITRSEMKEAEERGQYTKQQPQYLSVEDYLRLSPDDRKNWKKIDDDQYEYIPYGYNPTVKNTKQVETKLYEQEVEELDMAEVIKAVNKL